MKITGTRPGTAAGATGVQAYASVQRATAAKSVTAASAAGDVSSVLGIPEAEFTPAVRDAIVTLMAEVDRLRQDLEHTKERLESVQAMADQDSLLPLLNRRAFVREMSRIISFGDRYDLSASLIYFDLDGFKTVNDTHGHAAGDAVLKHVAKLLIENVRESDVVGRLGGDEFGVILPKAGKDQAEKKARALSDQIGAHPIHWEGKQLSLTVAFGIHQFQKGENPDAAMADADRAMYAAKRRKP
jgi:diguanylate cyclase (GGDEF)-like protein